MLKKFLNIFKIYEWIFLIIAIATLITLAIVFNAQPLEIVAPFLGVISAALNGKKKKYAFVTYTCYVLVYGSYSILEGQYGEAILNFCINLPMYLYTLFNFYVRPLINRKKKATQQTEGEEQAEPTEEESLSADFGIKPIKLYMVIGICIFIPLVTGLYGWALNTGFGGLLEIIKIDEARYAYINALGTALCITAVYLASKTIIWQWIFWFSYGAVGFTIWTMKFIDSLGTGQVVGVMLMVLNICFMIMNAYTLFLWISDLKKQKAAEQLAAREETQTA